MAGAMRKMAVYLGLVEDDRYDNPGYDPDDEFEPEPEPERDRRRQQPVHQSPVPDEPVRVPQPPSATGTHPDAGGKRTSGANRPPWHPSHLTARTWRRTPPVIMPKVVSEREPYRITTLHPRTYNEARTIGEHFREGTPVIMNLTEMDDTDAKRLVDFAAGLVFGLHGSIERVTQKVFLLSPANVDVTAEDKARIAEGGFFNQS
ncbi:cell division protein SepF [Streptomyces goshikiensis]